MDEKIEERLDPSAGRSELEEKIDDTAEKGFFRKAFDFTYLFGAAAGTTLLSTTFIGSTGLIVGGSLAGGELIGSIMRRGKSMYESITGSLKTYASFNMIIAPFISLGNVTFPLIGALGTNIASTIGAFTAKTTYAVTLYHLAYATKMKIASHLITNYLNPIGITKTIRENYWPLAKRKAIGLSPAYTLVANGVESIFGIPTFAYNAFPMGLYNGLRPI